MKPRFHTGIMDCGPQLCYEQRSSFALRSASHRHCRHVCVHATLAVRLVAPLACGCRSSAQLTEHSVCMHAPARQFIAWILMQTGRQPFFFYLTFCGHQGHPMPSGVESEEEEDQSLFDGTRLESRSRKCGTRWSRFQMSALQPKFLANLAPSITFVTATGFNAIKTTKWSLLQRVRAQLTWRLLGQLAS